MTPTRSMIEAYDPVWLADAALYWNRAADRLQDTFGQVHAQAQGLDWQGASGEALTAHTLGMHTGAIGAANQMRGAAAIAREGASNLSALASKARYAIEDAQADGFTVGEDLSVTDARYSRNPVERAARQAQAKTHTGNIARTATILWTHDTAVGSDMTNATAGIQAVDNHHKCTDDQADVTHKLEAAAIGGALIGGITGATTGPGAFLGAIAGAATAGIGAAIDEATTGGERFSGCE